MSEGYTLAVVCHTQTKRNNQAEQKVFSSGHLCKTTHALLVGNCYLFEAPSAQAVLLLVALVHCILVDAKHLVMHVLAHFNVEAGEKDIWAYLSCCLSLCQLLL